jgi:conjugative relaxase-like TrwC/TraI family protein
MLEGRHPNGEKLLAPVLRLHPKARLPAAPLLEAIQHVAHDQHLDVKVMLGDPRLIAAYAGLVRRSARGRRGDDTTVSPARARKLAAAAGLDPHTIYREADGTDRYAEAVHHAGERIDARRAGVDVTIAAPKSVSFVFGLADPHVADQIRAAHTAAVEQAWSYLHAQASDALRGHHGDGQSAARIGTDGPIVAAFDHVSSRAGDPQLHTHLVIPNLVHGADGRWSAMDTRALYRHAATASEIYHAVLRGELTLRLGVSWTTPARGRPEIAGIPRPLLRLFSTRRRQIEAELDRTGQSGPAAAQHACLTTRPAKTNVPELSLRERWETQTRQAGYDPERLVYGLLGRQLPPPAPEIARLQTELLGPAGVTRHATSFDRPDLLQALCQTLPAGLPVDHRHLEQLADRVLAGRDAVPLLARDENGERRYSTAELLSAEGRALALAGHLRRQPGAPMNPATVAAATGDSALSAEQAEVIRQLADSARLAVIVGPAGTGKTAALAAAHTAWQAAGIDVQGTALAAVTARRLADATGIPSCSLTRLLADADLPDPTSGQPRGLKPDGVVVLDEAGIVDTRKLAALLTHAAISRTALVLVGDPRQLPEIEAGGLFTQLARDPNTLHLTDNRRQRDGWERDALARLRAGNIDPAIDAYTAHGRIHHSHDPETLRAELVNDYLHARTAADNHYAVAILATNRADVAHLNALVRAAVIAHGKLGPTDLHLRTDNTADPDPGADSIQMRTGDLVIIGRNDNRAGLYNGTRAVVTAINNDAGSLTLHTDDDRDVTVTATWAVRHDLSHAYAMTLHKAQGLTVDHALLYGSDALTREAGYVGLSRGRRENHIYLSPATRNSGRAGECDFDQPDPPHQRTTTDRSPHPTAARQPHPPARQPPATRLGTHRPLRRPIPHPNGRPQPMTISALPEKLPPVLDLPTAAGLLGIGRTAAYQLVKTDQWPTTVIRVGRLIRIPTAPLLALLGIDR